MLSSNQNADVPFGIYLWVPLLLALSPYVLQSVFGEADFLSGERGIFEILTFVLLLLAVYFIVRAMSLAAASRIRYLPAWLVLMLLGSVYFAGEEVSWGQHFFLWQTPEVWQGLNDQQETNLHNTYAIFDQVPRVLLSLAALVGGIIVPLCRKACAVAPPVNEMAGWLWPTIACVPVCLFALLISLLDDVAEGLGDAVPAYLDISGGEMKECLLALFILFYAASLFRRLRAFAAGSW